MAIYYHNIHGIVDAHIADAHVVADAHVANAHVADVPVVNAHVVTNTHVVETHGRASLRPGEIERVVVKRFVKREWASGNDNTIGKRE